MEGAPGGVGLGGGLQGGREVCEEVEARPGLNLVDARHEVVVVLRVGVVVSVIEPESDSGRAGNLSVSVALNLEERFPIVVWNRKACRVGALAVGSGQVVDSLRTIHFAVCRAGYDINCIGCTADQRSFCRLQRAPDTAIEIILKLWRLVGYVVSLEIHIIVALAVGIRTLMATGVCVVPIHCSIAIRVDLHLLAVVDIWIISPG